MNMKVDKPHIVVAILNWNGKKDTLECLASVRQINYPHFQIVVVDNGSTDDSVAYIRREFPSITILQAKENLGYAGGNNLAIHYALSQGAEAVFLLNNDTIVDPDVLQHFASLMTKKPQAGIYGAHLLLYHDRQKVDHFGGVWNQKKGQFDLVRDFSDLDYACGAALLIKKEVFEAVGFLEPRFFLFWEESDFCFRAKKKGFVPISCPDAKVWHKVSSSFSGGKPHISYYWWRNRLLWVERNLAFKEKLSLWLRVLLPEIGHLLKLRTLKTLQCVFSSENAERKQKLLQYRASLHGVRDYTLRRFGSGPAWLYTQRML